MRDNLECACYVGTGDKKSNLSIILRTRVEDITHKLGTIDLKHSEDVGDIDLFAWTNRVVQSRDALSAQLQQNKTDMQKRTDTINELEKQLQDLIQAKESHETQLLTKFTLLLNEKKLRIRAQQRQLVEQGQPAKRTGSENRKDFKRKRRGTEDRVDNENNSEESEGFQAMDIERSTDILSETDRAKTPSVASDLDDDLDNSLQPADRAEERSRLPSTTPPPRRLPFPVQSDLLKQKRSQSIEKGDDETTSDDDDEL